MNHVSDHLSSAGYWSGLLLLLLLLLRMLLLLQLLLKTTGVLCQVAVVAGMNISLNTESGVLWNCSQRWEPAGPGPRAALRLLQAEVGTGEAGERVGEESAGQGPVS